MLRLTRTGIVLRPLLGDSINQKSTPRQVGYFLIFHGQNSEIFTKLLDSDPSDHYIRHCMLRSCLMQVSIDRTQFRIFLHRLEVPRLAILTSPCRWQGAF